MDNNSLELQVRNLIKESITKRMIGLEEIDPRIPNSTIVDRSLTDIMAVGFNNSLDEAAKDIYELQLPLEGITISQVLLEDIRARVFLSSNRFFEEIEAFREYVRLKDSASPEVVLFKVKEQLDNVEEGEFMIVD